CWVATLLSACFILRDRLPVQTEQTCDSTHKLFPTPFVSGIAVFIVEAEFFRHTKPAFPMFCRLEAEVEPALYLTELQERSFFNRSRTLESSCETPPCSHPPWKRGDFGPDFRFRRFIYNFYERRLPANWR